MAMVIAVVGGRPGMISAATGAMALLMITLVKNYGLEYLLAATILTGVFQILAGAFKLGVLLRFVSRSVMTGFVNALAILIFMAQMPELTDKQKKVLNSLTSAIMNKALHAPVTHLKKEAHNVESDFYIAAAQKLFDLEELMEAMKEGAAERAGASAARRGS